MGLSLGTQLGPFQILSAIGAGGIEEVYQAHDTVLGRDVAIEVLQEANVSRKERRMPMVKESKQTTSASQINVVLN